MEVIYFPTQVLLTDIEDMTEFTKNISNFLAQIEQTWTNMEYRIDTDMLSTLEHIRMEINSKEKALKTMDRVIFRSCDLWIFELRPIGNVISSYRIHRLFLSLKYSVGSTSHHHSC